jgi:ubiquitin carboxyl-terminal hydrolase 5/13
MLSLSSARQSEVKAWEEEITACEHTLCLEQLHSGTIPQEGDDDSPAYHDLVFIPTNS